MSPSHFQYPSTFKLFCFSLILPYIFAFPKPANTFYENSIQLLLAKDCKMPKEVDIPFQQNSDPNPFNYLSAPLKECQKTTDTLKKDEETHMLCKETFEVLQNITCSQFNVSLPQIKSTHFANDVCIGFMEMKGIFPKRDDSFAFGFAQSMPICKLLCKDRFQSLCQALLWSYDVQAQIEDVLENKKGALVNMEVAGKEESAKVSLNQAEQDTAAHKLIEDKQEVINNNLPTKDIADNVSIAKETDNPAKETDKPVIDEVNRNLNTGQALDLDNNELKVKKNTSNDLNDNHLISVLPALKAAVGSVSDKPDALDSTQNIQKNTEITKLTNHSPSLISGTSVTPKQNPEPVHIVKEIGGNTDGRNESPPPMKSEILDKGQPEEPQTNNQPSNSNVVVNPIAGVSEDIKPQVTSGASNPTGSNTTINNVQANSISVSVTPVNNPEENDLNNVNFQEEEEHKDAVKQTELKIPGASDKDKITEKNDETNSEISNKINIDPDLKIASTTSQIFPEKNAEEDPEDQYYNETENDDYPKPEYESTLNDLSTRKQNIKSSVVSEVASADDDAPNNYDLRRNNLHGREEVPMISSFPEQEDSHFFFYFLSIVLILMAGYLIFHNKQKILALILEGRHERRRRSHGAAYKKLETK